MKIAIYIQRSMRKVLKNMQFLIMLIRPQSSLKEISLQMLVPTMESMDRLSSACSTLHCLSTFMCMRRSLQTRTGSSGHNSFNYYQSFAVGFHHSLSEYWTREWQAEFSEKETTGNLHGVINTSEKAIEPAPAVEDHPKSAELGSESNCDNAAASASISWSEMWIFPWSWWYFLIFENRMQRSREAGTGE